MKKLLLLLSIILFAAFACSRSNNSTVGLKTNATINQPSDSNVPTEKPRLDFETFKKDLDNGKTYTSKYGISFKYPPYFTITEDQVKKGDVVSTIKIMDPTHVATWTTTQISKDDLITAPYLQILVEPARQAKGCYDLNTKGHLYSDIKDTDGFLFTINGVYGYHGCLGGGIGNGFHLEVQHGNYTYTFYVDSLSLGAFNGRDDSNGSLEILKTIKFTK